MYEKVNFMIMPRIEHQRLEYIDTAKGMCMTMLIFGHVGIMPEHHVLYFFSFPIFFVLSGFFLPTSTEIGYFVKTRVNKLLIPFLFFYLTSYILFYIGVALFPHIMSTEARGAMDVFTQRQWFNGPIWYLLCLFWSSIWIYTVCRVVKSIDLQALIVIFLGSIGATLGQKCVFLPLMLDVSLSALPLLYLGYIIKRLPLLYPNKYDGYSFFIGMALLGLVFFLTWLKPYNYVGFHTNTVVGNYYWTIITSIPAVLSVLYLCKSVKALPFFVFFGAYSIVPFSLHHLIYRPLIVAFDAVSVPYPLLFVALITVILSALMIPVMVKYVPWGIGLKKIIK